MEKFEKHIKEKLEARKIDPSAKAWEKISQELSTIQKPKRKRKYVYAIAAGFIGLLLVFGILLFNDESNENAIPIVEEDNVPKKQLKKEKSPEFKVQQMEVAESPEETPTESKYKEISKETLTDPVVVEIQENKQFNKVPLKDSSVTISEDIINKKVNEVMNQVIMLEDMANAEITDAEVDSLLRAAQRDILTDKLLNPEGKVDAMALLTEVEDELDESFRDQIFEALKQGYLKVKTAVADRNN
ncbi:hypothetical protein [Flagellimonas meridianipacifica]|uniref:Uncharacterized protein n=1 Tax=Flagellimonas meridianipacifica TaxID=1080225 RepID=A0A2T0MJV5_9FLAO|nr:hypothetical protein [Allomuricauda pacifica]PRX57864.1 hypothetical protein CLV81_1877 [Allomuricauda pacifica]